MNDSILITLPQSYIKEHSYKSILETWKKCDGENMTWWFRMSRTPRKEFYSVYWVIKGKVRYKSTVADIGKDKWVRFNNGIVMYSKCWLVLFDFEYIPKPYQLSKKGFQGFRYFNSEDLFNEEY